MRLGQTIQQIRKDNNLTQERFADLFHVTRQTVSNWENEKSYPDLITLVAISNQFDISLDKMLKEDVKMTEELNNEIEWAKKSKKRRTKVLVLAAILLMACTLSPGGALRTAVFFHSPVSAVTMSYEEIQLSDEGERLYRITENEPVEKATQGHLYTWVVHEWGPFHFAEYYGEC